MDLLESLAQTVRHMDDDGLAVSGDINLLRGIDEEVAKLTFELRVGRLQIEEGLGDGFLELVRLLPFLLLDLPARGERHGYCRGDEPLGRRPGGVGDGAPEPLPAKQRARK